MKTKVLFFVDRLLVGGIQVFLTNVLNHIDKEKFQIDLLLLDDGVDYPLEETFKGQGIKIYKLNGVWIRKPQDLINHSKKIKEFFKEHHDYNVVHMNSGSKNYPVLKYAKKYGISVRIAHSHNVDFQTNSKAQKLMGNAFKILLKKYATDYFGCSKEAGIWLFGEKVANQNNFSVMPNAIDYDKFKSNSEIRKNIRTSLNIKDDEFVVGHVGRFTHQKNHVFLINMFDLVFKQNPKFKLLLVGDGELKEDIKNQIKNLGIEKSIIFTGFKTNANDFMQAMDIFVMPSEFEGLGIVLIEAQANGMKCFASNVVIPQEAKVSEQLEFIDLQDGEKAWAEKVISSNLEKKNTFNDLKNRNYIISDMVKELELIYLK